jgi:hypothetical protein
MARILIIAHDYDKYVWRQYLLGEIGKVWAGKGHRVEVCFGLKAPPPADAAMVHVDLSVVPQPFLDAAARYPRAFNTALPDIRKRTISTMRVQRGDGYAGPVMVKSDLNAGGQPEAVKCEVASRLGTWSGPPFKALSAEYPVYDKPDEVPAEVWSDPSRIVERFVSEVHGKSYCLRLCYFLGEAEENFALLSTNRVVKTRYTTGFERTPPPAGMRALRARLGLTYGKLDYILRDGKIVLFDVNRTPAFGFLQRFGVLPVVRASLAAGLDALL